MRWWSPPPTASSSAPASTRRSPGGGAMATRSPIPTGRATITGARCASVTGAWRANRLEADHLTLVQKASSTPSCALSARRRHRACHDAAPDAQIPRRDRADPGRGRGGGCGRLRDPRRHPRRRARDRRGHGRPRRDGTGDRAPLSRGRIPRHLGLVPVGHQHRRRAQPGDGPRSCNAWRYPEPQHLPDDLGLLHRAGADAFRRRGRRGQPRHLGGQCRHP
jgi:hypothetical protein